MSRLLCPLLVPEGARGHLHTVVCAEGPCLAWRIDHVPISLTCIGIHKVQGHCLYFLGHVGTMQSAKKSLPRISKAPVRDEDVDPYDFLAQERLEMNGSEDLFEGTISLTPLQIQRMGAGTKSNDHIPKVPAVSPLHCKL